MLTSARLQLLVTLAATVTAAGIFALHGLPPNEHPYTAVVNGDLTEVRRALRWGADPAMKSDWNGWGYTLLHAAISGRKDDVVRFLLDYGVDPNVRNDFDQTPLHMDYCTVTSATLLIARGADVRARCSGQYTALHYHRTPELIKLLVAHGADVNARDDSGLTPLHWAVAHTGVRGSAVALLDLGADINLLSGDGRTPLSDSIAYGYGEDAEEFLRRGADPKIGAPLVPAARYGMADVATLLIDHGAHLNARGRNGQTALVEALAPAEQSVTQAHRELALLLIRRGADVKVTDLYGLTPLHIAMMDRFPDVATALLDRGADVNARRPNGRTPLHCLWENQQDTAPRVGLARLLLTRGAQVDARDTAGDTALLGATQCADADGVELLLSHGANPNLQGQYNLAPLHYAAEHKSSRIAELLLGVRGIALDPRDNRGLTPLLLALCNGENKDIARRLIWAGADVNAKGADNTNRWPPLHCAVNGADREMVDRLLAHGADINVQDKQGFTPLHLAVVDDFDTIARFLIEKGADVNLPNEEGAPPLYSAVWNKPRFIDLLLSHGASTKTVDKHGERLFHAAIAGGRAEFAKQLFADGADMNAECDGPWTMTRTGEWERRYGWTPLFFAARAGRTGMIEWMITNGANLKARDSTGRSPLHYVLDPAMASLLIAHGLDVNAAAQDGSTPLHDACRDREGYRIVERLIAKGAQVNAQDTDGRTPLWYAIAWKHEDIAALLIWKGTDLRVVDKDGNTPLHWAAAKDQVNVARFLISRGADIRAKNRAGETPLHSVAASNGYAVADMLIAAGARLNAPSNDGSTPLHLAAAKDHYGLADYLRREGANVNATDKTGRTPLQVAQQMKHEGVADWLTRPLDADEE